MHSFGATLTPLHPRPTGKSTFENELRGYLETEFSHQSEKEKRGKVVVLAVSLPTLRNPLGDLFHESLAAKGLRDAQIAELRDKAAEGSVRLVFLLDGYDEMKSECLFKNLYTANNLEQYARRGGGGPKVIISTRTELLSQNADYVRSFTPAVDGEAEDGGGGGLLELRLGAFDGKLATYVHAHVALQLRREWEKRVGALLPLTPELASELMHNAADAWGDQPEEEWWTALRDSLSVAGGEGRLADGTLEEVHATARGVRDAARAPTTQSHAGAVLRAAAVLMGALETLPTGPEEVARGFLQQFRDDHALWLPGKYLAAFDAIPELRELTKTPFMVRIVVEILRELEKEQSTDAAVKQRLHVLLDERAVHALWERVHRYRAEAGGEVVEVAGEAFGRLVDDCRGQLRVRELLFAQTALLEVADKHLRALSDGGSDEGGLSEAERKALPEEQAEGERAQLVAAAVRTALAHALQHALERPAVRTRHIYATFVTAWVEREARKRVNHGAFDPEKVRREATEWGRQLALTMVIENVTKVSTQATSKLFHRADVWDPFLHTGGELRLAAARAAPVRFTDVLSFIHKTVQEFLCAETLRLELQEALKQPAASVGAMLEALVEVEGGGGASSGEEEAEASQRRVEKALARTGERLAESAWARVELAREDAVRDFLVDAYLDDEEGFGDALRLLVLWAKREAGGAHKAAATTVMQVRGAEGCCVCLFFLFKRHVDNASLPLPSVSF